MIEITPKTETKHCNRCRMQLPIIRLIARWTDIVQQMATKLCKRSKGEKSKLGYRLAGSTFIGQ